MKVRRSLLIALSLLSISASAQRIKGSDTVLPVAQQTAERFMNQHPDTRVTVTGGGTGVGISALLDNTTDIAMASRPIKFSEKMKIKSAGEDVAEIVVAYDALAVVAHPSNPVKQLTRQQLEDIFRGKITNWKQVGGDDRKIVVYSRETSSGTYEFFKESVLKNKNYMASSLSMPATGAIIQSVSQTKGAIGYVGLAYVPLAVGVLQAFATENVIVPQDIKVISINNQEIAKYTSPALSSYDISQDELAKAAVLMLAEALTANRKISQHMRISTSLVTRDSFTPQD